MAWKPAIHNVALIQAITGIAQENGHKMSLFHIISHDTFHRMADYVLMSHLADTFLARTHTHSPYPLHTLSLPSITINTTTVHLNIPQMNADSTSSIPLATRSLLSWEKA